MKVASVENRRMIYALRSAGASAILSLLVAGCVNDTQTTQGSGPPLTRTEWRLVEFVSSDDAIGTIRPKSDEVYTLTLQPDGSITMQLSCNRGGGQWKSADYRQSRGSLTLTMGFSSMAACPPGNFDTLTQRLGNVRTFVIEGGRLHLNLMADAGNYVWQAQEERRVSYACSLSPDVTLVFRGDTAELARPGEPTIQLQRQPNGDFAYDAAVRSARLSGETLTLITGRMAPNICQQK